MSIAAVEQIDGFCHAPALKRWRAIVALQVDQTGKE